MEEDDHRDIPWTLDGICPPFTPVQSQPPDPPPSSYNRPYGIHALLPPPSRPVHVLIPPQIPVPAPLLFMCHISRYFDLATQLRDAVTLRSDPTNSTTLIRYSTLATVAVNMNSRRYPSAQPRSDDYLTYSRFRSTSNHNQTLPVSPDVPCPTAASHLSIRADRSHSMADEVSLQYKECHYPTSCKGPVVVPRR